MMIYLMIRNSGCHRSPYSETCATAARFAPHGTGLGVPRPVAPKVHN